MEKSYEVYLFTKSGTLIESYRSICRPTGRVKEENVLFIFEEAWTENPICIVSDKLVIFDPKEIDKYLMCDLDGRFLSWLSDRPNP